MVSSLDFVFDFASPNAYLAHRALPGVLERTGAEVHHVPCLLGGIFKATGNQPPMVAFGNVKGKLAYEQIEMQRFTERHGIDRFRFNPHFPVTTLMLMRGAIAMEQDGRLPEYLEAGFRLMWEEGEKMDDPEVFSATLTNAGFDGAELLRRTQDPAVKQQLIANTESAVERGCFGIPTFFVGDEMYFGKDRLDQVEEALRAAR